VGGNRDVSPEKSDPWSIGFVVLPRIDTPLYSPNVQANTDPSTYDVLGRRFFAGFNGLSHSC
jgi:hypothetical protein